MKRSKPLQRTTRLRASGPIRPKKRSAADKQRVYGTPERIEWLKAQPSVASGRGPCENVHVRTDGMSRKADARFIVPLTHEEHRELHQIGTAAFEAKYNISLALEAERTEMRWRRMHAEVA